MKKLLFIAALFISVGSFAQGTSIAQGLYSNPASGVQLLDTVTNTGVVTMTSKIVAGAPYTTTISHTFTKLTGTAAGTAILLGSINGVDFESASSTSYTVTDVATQSTSWVLSYKPYLYYRVQITGSGTSTYTVKGQVLTVIR